MTFVEFLICTGPTVGFVIGTWWSRNRLGGLASTRAALAAARQENVHLRAQLTGRADHPSLGPLSRPRRLQLVREGNSA